MNVLELYRLFFDVITNPKLKSKTITSYPNVREIVIDTSNNLIMISLYDNSNYGMEIIEDTINVQFYPHVEIIPILNIDYILNFKVKYLMSLYEKYKEDPVLWTLQNYKMPNLREVHQTLNSFIEVLLCLKQELENEI